MSISTINTQQGHVEEGAGDRVSDTSISDGFSGSDRRPVSHASTLLPIHTDTQQEIDQAEQRKAISRNPETGEVMPVAVATLEGGDGEGMYVSAKQYVALECFPVSAKLTPKAARLVAADLIAAADALEPRKRGKGKKRCRKALVGQGPAQASGVSAALDTPLVVDGHVGPAWATTYTESRDAAGNLDALYWSIETVELPTAETATASVGVMRTDELNVTGRWVEGRSVVWTDGGLLEAEHLAGLIGKLTEVHDAIAPPGEDSFAGVHRPVWATEVDDDGGAAVVYSRVSETTVHAMTGDGTTTGRGHTPVLNQSAYADGRDGPAHIYPIATDEAFTVDETRKLIGALTELCNLADGGPKRVPTGRSTAPAWATGGTQELGASVWTVEASEPATDTLFNTITPVLSQSNAQGTVLAGVPVIFPGHGDAMFTVTEARVLAAGILELCDKADEARSDR